MYLAGTNVVLMGVSGAVCRGCGQILAVALEKK